MTSLAQAKIIATRMSEDLAEDRAWFQGSSYVSASYCRGCPECDTRSIDEAAPDGKCAGGFIFTKHDAREA